jgi:hypothetical protein
MESTPFEPLSFANIVYFRYDLFYYYRYFNYNSFVYIYIIKIR